ncbi:hypothetical protein [Erwinia psidii]|uniref:Uncharacterized protein n=1 Tax=Erwinia psidii TaxID=69224 RepID=A0A3N6TM98_9GAMM|nr:hypothetical protein [Erwinia psidii]MCX8959572.1 hypothetical protein [Erwinia psidii]RQM36342.1 hypothetical protein EB241_21075 [Erwinia psidii]
MLFQQSERMKVGVQEMLTLKNKKDIFSMKNMLISFFFSVLLLLSHSSQAQIDLPYEPAVVELKGIISINQFDGPPNYGEGPDDKKVNVPVLRLSEPVNVNPASGLSDDDPDNQLEKKFSSYRLLITEKR